jgi:SAM-dependent methyltransferase
LVFAVDIDERFLDYIKEEKARFEDQYKNIITVKAEIDDPKLPDDELDAILVVNTYHLLTNRVSYLKKLAKALKQNGVLLIVDYKPEITGIGPTQEIKLNSKKVVDELNSASYKIVTQDYSLPYQYVIKSIKR